MLLCTAAGAPLASWPRPPGQHHLHDHICKNNQATRAEANLLASLATAEHVQAARSAEHEPRIDGTVATTSPANPMVRMVPQNHPRHSDQLEHHLSIHGYNINQSELQTMQFRPRVPHPLRRLSWPDESQRVPATKMRDVNHRKLTGLGARASRPASGMPCTPFESAQSYALCRARALEERGRWSAHSGLSGV